MSVITSIGNTPLVELNRINPNKRVRILAKLEGCNPGGSVKDRPALFMIRQAEQDGLLTPERTILEPTSGNTGIALAMIAAARGYRVKLFMPACASVERQRILEALGAEVVLTCAQEKTDGAIRKAHETLEASPDLYFMPNQFANPANPLSHYYTTGPEIWNQTAGEVTCFVAGIGSGGTLMGVARYLKERQPHIQIVGVEPVTNHAIEGLKNLTESVVPDIFNADRLDGKVMVNDDESFQVVQDLAQKEGLFVGLSSGAAVAGALKVARDMASGTIVVILPDRGERYLSTARFRSICAKCPV